MVAFCLAVPLNWAESWAIYSKNGINITIELIYHSYSTSS